MVFGIPIEGWPLQEILARLSFDGRKKWWIVTANPEILLEARRDPSYAAAIRQADLRTVDGFGLWALLRLFGHTVSRTTGVELAESLAALAAERGWRVGLLGGSGTTASRAAQSLKEKFPHLSVSAEQGGQVARDGQDDLAGEEARHRLTMFAPDVLLVAFGHPKQEYWIGRHLAEFPSVKVAIGVGGTFDYWAGSVARAPRLIRRFGFEWLWRLIFEPRRIKRIWNATVLFPAYFLMERFFHH